jgi:PilZ domain
MKNRHSRIKLNKHVELFWQGMKKYADIEDISVGGALVRTDIPVQVGDFMAVYLQNPAGPGTLEIGGEVVRIKPSRWGLPAFAVKFKLIPKKLRTFLNDVMAKDNGMLRA